MNILARCPVTRQDFSPSQRQCSLGYDCNGHPALTVECPICRFPHELKISWPEYAQATRWIEEREHPIGRIPDDPEELFKLWEVPDPPK